MKILGFNVFVPLLLKTAPVLSQDHHMITDTINSSPQEVAMANVGGCHVHIEYSSPAVRNRVVWGGLVPYGVIWVTGAHQATSISFSKDVTIAGNRIKKGKYAFFTIPTEKEWTLILNKNWKRHLADDYSQKEDVLRWKVSTQDNEHTERLNYRVIARNRQSGFVEMEWEKIKISFRVDHFP